jgi:monoamine oxidase
MQALRRAQAAAQGRRSGNLHFAGEHTSVDFQGYMEGAVRSGYRCAAEIAGRTPS